MHKSPGSLTWLLSLSELRVLVGPLLLRRN